MNIEGTDIFDFDYRIYITTLSSVDSLTYFFAFMVCYYYSIFEFDFLESSCYNPLHNKHNIHYCEHILVRRIHKNHKKGTKNILT